MTITTRAGKGSALTFEELDENFTFLLGRTNSLSAIVTASLDNDGEAAAGIGIQFHVANLAQGNEEDANINLSKFIDADGNAASSASLYPVITSAELGITTATANGSGGLTYSSANKQFTFTPPDLSSFLTSSSSISSTQLPSISLTSVTTVADEQDVVDLSSSTQEGDVVLQTNGTKSYVRNSGSAGTIADFTELLTPDSDTTYGVSIEQTGGNDTDPTLNLTPNQGTADTVTIKGGGATTVSRTDSGESVTITSTNTTYDSKAVENSLSSVTPAVTDVTNDVVTTDGAHTINNGTIIRVSETNDDTGLTLGEYTVSNTNKAGGTFTLVGVGTETTLSGANFHILNNDNPRIRLIGSDTSTDSITLTGGSNTTVTRISDSNIQIDGIGDTSYDYNADKSADSNLPSMTSVSNNVVTFSSNHGLSDGDEVRIENAGVSGINAGDFTVSSENGSNQFTATGIGSATGSLLGVTMKKISINNPDLRLVGSDGTTDRVKITGSGQVTVTRDSVQGITIASSPSGTSTAIQKGDGAGGFSDATAGSDFLGTIGNSSGIQKGNGNGALTDAVEGTDYNSPDKIGARFRLPSGNNSVVGTQKHIEIATINITGVGESYKASFVTNTTDYADNTTITETTHISIRQTAAFGNNPEIYLSTETSRKTGDLGVFCKTRKTSVTSPSNLSQVKLYIVLDSSGDVGAEGFVTSETVSDSSKVSATWETSFAETDYLSFSEWGAIGGAGEIGDDIYLHTTRSERWDDLFSSTPGIVVTDGTSANPINVIGNGTGFLKNNGSGTYSYDNTTYSTLALGTTNTTALAGDTVVDNLLLEIPKSSGSVNAGDKSFIKVAEVTIDARYEYYSAQLAVVGTGAAEGVANEKILAIRVKQQADMGSAPLVDIDIYNNGNEDYDFGHVVAVNSATETRVDIYFRPDGPNSGAEVYKMADTATATVAWSSTGNSYATSAPANFVQGGAHQQWHSGNQAGIFGSLNGLLKVNGSGVLSAAVGGTSGTIDYSTVKIGTGATDALAGNTTFVAAETDPVVGAITGIVKADGAGNISAAVGGTSGTIDYSTVKIGTGATDALAGNTTYVASESDPVVGAITGIVKADGSGNISAAVAGTDYSTLAIGTSGTTALAGNTTFSTLANSSTAADTITIGASAQTGAITIGNSTKDNTINIGNAATESDQEQIINIGSGTGSGTSTVNIAAKTSQGNDTAVTIGGNDPSTGTCTVAINGTTTVGLGNTTFQGNNFLVNPNLATNTITLGSASGTGTITIGRSTGSQTIDIASASNAGSKTSTVNIAQGGGTRTVNIASDSHSGSTTVIYAGNPSGTANSTILLRGNLSIDRPMYGNGAPEYYDFFDHLGGMLTTGSDGDWDISGTGLNALTEITIPATSHVGTLGKRGSLRMTCHSIFYNSSSTTKRNAEYYLGLQMKSKSTTGQSENLGAATLVSSPSQFNGVWSFAGNVTDQIVAGFGALAMNNSAAGMTYGPAPILGVIYDDSVNKTYIRVSSYYYYNSLGGTALSNGQTTSFDVYYNPTEFKSTGTWVSSMRADSYGSRNRMTVQPQSTHQMHHAFNISLPKQTSKTELRLIFDYSGSNTDLTASVHAVEGTVMLEGSRV